MFHEFFCQKEQEKYHLQHQLFRILQCLHNWESQLMEFALVQKFVMIKKNLLEQFKNFSLLILQYYTFTCFVLIAVRSTICWIKGGIYLALKEGIKWIYISIYGIGNGRGSIYINTKLQICHTDEIGMLWFLLACVQS